MIEQKMPETKDGMPVPQRYWAMIAIGLGVMVSVLDGAIANVALPTIATDLHTNPSNSIWIVNAYQLAITISLLSLSSVGDIWGYRKVYTGGLLLFSFTSLACALSDSMFTLTTARALQGFGAAAITSVNTALIRIVYPVRSLAKGMGINALVVSVSAAAGPTVAAGILSVADWPWLFAVNIPVGLLAFWISYKYLPQNPVKNTNQKFDKLSGVLNALTFGLVIALIEGFTHDIPFTIIIGGFILLLISAYILVRRQFHRDNPLLPVDLLKIPIFSVSIITSLLSFVAQMLALVSLPFLLQRSLDKDEVATGLLLTPWPLTTMIFAPLAGYLSGKMNSIFLSALGLVVFAAGLFLLSALPSHPSDTDIIWRMAICGCGFGLFQTPNNSIIVAAAPENRSGGASGMLGVARLLGQTSGAALVALMFSLFPVKGTYMSLLTGSIVAATAALLTFSRSVVMLSKKQKESPL